MDRRHFLQLGLAGASLLPLSRTAWAIQGQAPTQRKLIVIMLRGAVDGLSVLVPHGEAEYYHARDSIALARPGTEGGALDLDGYFGLHPALAPLLPLWQARQLAFVPASGSPDATRSHFDAQDYLESATPGRKSTPDGWMNRLLANLPGATTPTRGLSIGPVLPRILSGPISVATMASGEAAGRPGLVDQPKISAAFAQLYAQDARMNRHFREGQDTRQEVMGMLAQDMSMADGGALPAKGFPGDAARLATLLRRDPKIQLAFLALGGWDTHINQGNAQGALANNLAPLAQGLAELTQNLGPQLADTCILVMSEFGRTVKQNGTGGTDHGHGNVMWLLGGTLAGGKIHGDWRGLANNTLYEGRDVPVTTDFRSVLAQILAQHLRLPDAQLSRVLPDEPSRAAALKLFG